MDLEMEEILSVFFQESTEGLDAMESGLLDLDVSVDRETINTIFRAAHSIKGGAGTFGFMEISQFTHSVETLLDEMRTGSRSVTSDATQVLLQAVDVMREMIESAQSKRPIACANADSLTRKLTALLAQHPASVTAPSHGAETKTETQTDAGACGIAHGEAGVATWHIEFRPDRSLFKTCNDPLRIFAELQVLGTLQAMPDVMQLPAFTDLDPTQCYLAWTLEFAGPVQQSQLAEVFDWVDASSSIVYRKVSKTPPTAALAPVTVPTPAMAAALAPKPPADSGSIRVAIEKVDALINLVGELVITQSMLSGLGDTYAASNMEALRRGLTQLSRNTRDLQESVLKIRMLPISFSFNRFPRMVHELSRTLGKKIELKLNGENTELDKVVLEKIGDPLVHLVRNSLDHGLESPQRRLAAGKSETGILELNAFHEGGSIIIEVKDDGAGLDKQRILAKARERGLIEPDANLSDDQIHHLIFLPGFSTAETVSDLSGRGVGMDVVRRNINDIGGDVHVYSTAGQGSTIRIRLPLTLAILEGQMLRVGKEIYVISLVSIIETVQPSRTHLHSITGRTDLFKHRDEYLPVIRLYDMFGIDPDSLQIEEGLLIVVESDGRRVAILVDELLAQQQVVIKSLDTNFRQIAGLAGATIHGDGTVALILDVPSLIRKFLDDGARRFDLAA